METETRTGAEAMADMREELRRGVRGLRIWVGMVTLGFVGTCVLLATGGDYGLFGTAAALLSQIVLFGMRWWPVERALHATRHCTEAIPVEIVTPRWANPVTVRTPDGAHWTWAPSPTRMWSAAAPLSDRRSWIAGHPEQDPRPVLLVSEPHSAAVYVASRPARRVEGL